MRQCLEVRTAVGGFRFALVKAKNGADPGGQLPGAGFMGGGCQNEFRRHIPYDFCLPRAGHRRVDRQIGLAGFQHRQSGDDHLRRVVNQVGHTPGARPSVLSDGVCDPVGSSVKVSVGPLPALAGESDVIWKRADHLCEAPRHRLLDVRARKRQAGRPSTLARFGRLSR